MKNRYNSKNTVFLRRNKTLTRTQSRLIEFCVTWTCERLLSSYYGKKKILRFLIGTMTTMKFRMEQIVLIHICVCALKKAKNVCVPSNRSQTLLQIVPCAKHLNYKFFFFQFLSFFFSSSFNLTTWTSPSTTLRINNTNITYVIIDFS